MGISATATSTWSLSKARSLILVGALVFGLAFYAFGPPIVPLLRGEAVKACNEHAGGNFRSYRLSWVLGRHPHWSCWDASDPMKPAVDLGWLASTLR